jgi:tRNA (guanine37-N1)-methyltransferase
MSAMRFEIVTLFPQMFAPALQAGVIGRAFANGLAQARFWNPRDYAADKHRTVDDQPFGGGSGMVLAAPPLASAIRAIRRREEADGIAKKTPCVALSAQGRLLNQDVVGRLSKCDALILLCGRYRGIDERVLEKFADEEISIGDYVISGGELAALVIIDALLRRRPGVLGNPDSADDDSFAADLLDAPCYTRPADFEGAHAPATLLSGDHAAIRRWRMTQSLRRTWERKPEIIRDLAKRGKIGAEARAILLELNIPWDATQ